MDLGESLIKIEEQVLSSFHKVTEGKHPTFRFKVCYSLTGFQKSQCGNYSVFEEGVGHCCPYT
jgi:hypothetical protein